MYTILNQLVAVPPASVDLVLSSRPTRGINANQQKLVTLRSTELYRQSFSIRMAKDWNSLPQSVVAAVPSAQQESALRAWNSVGAQLFIGVILQYGALPTNYTDPDPDNAR